MGIRTIFNMLGPLTNPASADAQIIGVYSAHLTELLAAVLCELGSRRALVAHGSDGMDEVSISGETKITELNEGKIRTYTIRPEEFGIERASLKEIQGGDALRNSDIIRAILKGERGPRRDIVALNASAALLAGSLVGDLKEGIELASKSIDSGAADDKLKRLIEFTNR